METYGLSRKERRKAEKNDLVAKQIKKSSTVLGSAIVLSSVAAPVILPVAANATEDNTITSTVNSIESYESQVQDVEIYETTETEESTMDETLESASDDTSDSALEENKTSVPATPPSTDLSDLLSDNLEADREENTSRLLPETNFASFSMSRNVNPATFIAEISGPASTVANANDLYASVMIAQAILESDWGRSTLGAAPNYNLFGIKGSYEGQSVIMTTWESVNGEVVYIDAAFRKYPSHLESFYDNAYVLKNTSFQSGVYYYSGAWKSNTNSYRDATAYLTGRYATDPNYSTKLNNIIETYNLTQYDTPSTGNSNTGNSNTGTINTGNSNTNNSNTNNSTSTSNTNVLHTVKSGDSLWALANKYGTSVEELKSWNGLSSHMIYVGQQLIVGKTAGSSTGNTTGNTTTSNTTYTVKSGDSLWAIANKYGTSVSNLKSWNSLSGDTIYPGQQLTIKQTSSSSNTTTVNDNASGNSTTTTSNTTYTVKSGDSLWAIANKYSTSVSNLKSWNSLNADIIYPGQQLIVKQDGSSSGAVTISNRTNGNSTTATSNTAYTVKSGDTLWGISKSSGLSIQQIKQLNGLNGDTIYIGQQLKLK